MIRNLAADVQAFTSNVFLVDGQRRSLIDTGSNFDVIGRVTDHLSGLDTVAITHTHPDHVGNLGEIREAFDVEVIGFGDEEPAVDRAVEDGDTVQIGNHEYTAYHTPGHARDHLCFHSPDTEVCFVGDLVFTNGGYGRTDLEGGDRSTLIDSLTRISNITDGSLSEFHSGHGSSSTEAPSQDIDLAVRMAQNSH